MRTSIKKTLKRSFTVTSCAVISSLSFAQSSGIVLKNSNSKTSTMTSTLKNIQDDSNEKSNLKGSISFQSNEWVQDVGEVVGNKYFGEVNIDYHSNKDGDFEKKFNLASRVNDKENLMFSVPEAYLRIRFGSNDMTFGRAVLPWSELDKEWGFGKLNNRINFDGFNPGQEGLTGVSFNHRNANGFNVSLFGSVLYVPEMNPGTKIDPDKGTVTCDNPWCKAPSPTADVEGKNIPIYYNVNYPEISDVVFRYSLGGRIGYEDKQKSFHGFLMRKPENQMSTTAEVAYENANQRIYADVTPQFYYHDVAGAETKLKLSDRRVAYGSFFRISPNSNPDGNQPYIEYTGIKPNKKLEEYLGTGIGYETEKFKAKLNYIARTSEFDISNDTLVEYPRWNQAYNISLLAHVTRKLSMGFDYKYDMLTEDRLTMFNADYAVKQNMMISVGANMIGSSGNGESYWSDFVNNDTVYSSFKYTF